MTSGNLAEAAAQFDGGRLTLARRLSGLRKNALAAAVELTPAAISFYESGTKRPSPPTVAKLALALGVEPRFFLPGAGAAPATAHFRSLRSTTQLARDQAEAYVQVVTEVTAVLERHVDFPPVRLVSAPVPLDCADDAPERAAAALRALWDLGDGPVPHTIRAAEGNGVLTVFTPPQSASVDAYSVSRADRPLVLLNPAKDDYYRQRFDVAHELGHLVMHADEEPGNTVVENQANRFAAEFLLPAAAIADHLPTRADWPRLATLKEHWGVSLQALLYRARQLGRMRDVTYRNAMTTISTRGWRRREPGTVLSVEQPSLLPRALELLPAGLLAAESRVPDHLLAIVTSRTPAG
ncbi:helix-turn-helix domain-containing protein [Actinokineospora bangkokensis]|uniref:Xre family DNA binding protein n=1 Tax=Actinokineospora bangkokensis TaxID=1193682 RepID=A0A1Q9LHB6_9PSEU|nr:XRE family transcriptional regulator [Actinokineospora bangkokensis]OLR91416.1 Xre family DNA binding protein [Actinokineospora bangkokensis]